MKILVADDDPVSRRLLQAHLTNWGYEVVVACHGDEAWQILQGKDAPRIAILDWMMPGKDGVQICREARSEKIKPYVYILLLTAKGLQEDIVEGFEAGADDYVTKPFAVYQLRARLRAGRRIIELQDQLTFACDSLREEALHDPLTSLWNRKGILDHLDRELSRSDRTKTSVAVALLDVDHFKQINDTYGHLAGDAVLRQVALRLRGAMRAYDGIGRYGGDEFLAVVWGCDTQAALCFAESLREHIDQRAIDTSEGIIHVTLTIGVAATSEMQQASAEGLFRAADAALYRAKAAGRNRTEVAQAEKVER
jgi:two-component system cell cycle response regulator